MVDFTIEALYLLGSLHGTDFNAGLALKAQLRFDHGAVLHELNGRTRAQVNATAAANTFFPVDSYHF